MKQSREASRMAGVALEFDVWEGEEKVSCEPRDPVDPSRQAPRPGPIYRTLARARETIARVCHRHLLGVTHAIAVSSARRAAWPRIKPCSRSVWARPAYKSPQRGGLRRDNWKKEPAPTPTTCSPKRPTMTSCRPARRGCCRNSRRDKWRCLPPSRTTRTTRVRKGNRNLLSRPCTSDLRSRCLGNWSPCVPREGLRNRG